MSRPQLVMAAAVFGVVVGAFVAFGRYAGGITLLAVSAVAFSVAVAATGKDRA